MNIINAIKDVPLQESIYWWDGRYEYTVGSSTELHALAESHERLLKVALRSAGHWELLRPIRVVPEDLVTELQAAIEQAEQLYRGEE